MGWIETSALVVGGYGTGAGFVVAAVGYVYNRSRYRKAQKYEQARQFSAWVASARRRQDVEQGIDVDLDFWNGNPHAIGTVLAAVYLGPYNEAPVSCGLRAMGQIPPTKDPYRTTVSAELPSDVKIPEEPDFGWACSVEVDFADTMGNCWRRDTQSRLTEQPRWLPRQQSRRRVSALLRRGEERSSDGSVLVAVRALQPPRDQVR